MPRKFSSIKEKQAAETAPAKTAVSSMKEDKDMKTVAFKKNEKKKMISAYVDIEQYEMFQQINKKRGISSNAALNMYIADYVNAYKEYL